jgi:Uma2 family endonuclease
MRATFTAESQTHAPERQERNHFLSPALDARIALKRGTESDMNVAVTRAAEGFDRRSFTVYDVRRMIDTGIMDEDERVELVEGELVVMAAKGYPHDLIKSGLNLALARALPTDMIIGIENSIQFTDKTILEPDLVVFKRSARARSEADFAYFERGNLLLAIEVAVSSLNYDRGLKARLYARYGVPELWVIDANERIACMHRDPNGDAWSSITERGATDPLTTPTLPGFSVRLADID